LSHFHVLAASTIVANDRRRIRHVRASPRLRVDLVFRMERIGIGAKTQHRFPWHSAEIVAILRSAERALLEKPVWFP
jgi:hypothetical protein